MNSTLQNYTTRQEMDARFLGLGESLNTRFDKVDDRMTKIEKLAVNNAKKLT